MLLLVLFKMLLNNVCFLVCCGVVVGFISSKFFNFVAFV